MPHGEPTPSDQRSEAELRRDLESLAQLVDIAQALAAETELDQVLRRIVDEARRAVDCERASLFRYDAAQEQLYTAVVTELEIQEIRHGADYGIAGYVARTGAIANIPDPQQDARWNGAVDQTTGFRTRNILAAPLLCGPTGKLLGVLQLLNKQGGTFEQADEQLLTAIGRHAALAMQRAELIEQLRSQQHTEASLRVAREIQRDFMPSQLPTAPGYEVATWWFPNEAVGGDYCDVIKMPNGRLGLCVADVSGHGIGPSLIMASVRAALRALLLEHSAPDELLRLLAQALHEDLQHGLFITLVLAMLDPATHEVNYANAGHGPALRYVAASGQFIPLEATGLPLGVLEDQEYPTGEPQRLEPGDLLILCTDGIVEATDVGNQQFGMERLHAIIRRDAQRPVEEIARQIGAEVEAHFVGESPDDDLTVLVARRNQ